MDTYYVKNEPTCPTCGELLSMVSGEDGTVPAEGDLTMCLTCHTTHIYGVGLSINEMTAEQVKMYWEECPEVMKKLDDLKLVTQYLKDNYFRLSFTIADILNYNNQ